MFVHLTHLYMYRVLILLFLAIVTSAFELEAEQQQLLVDALRKRFNCEVTLKVEIDKRLIGGVVIRTGDMVIDGSIRGKLAKLAESLKS